MTPSVPLLGPLNLKYSCARFTLHIFVWKIFFGAIRAHISCPKGLQGLGFKV